MRYQRTSAEEKAEIIELVRKSPLPVKDTLERLGVPPSTYYGWLRRKRIRGPDGLQDRRPRPRRVWNQLREQEVDTVLQYADQETDSTSREIAYRITDHAGFSVSESTVYRILRRHDLIFPAQVAVAQAAKEFRRKSTRVHELWQTDLTYFFVNGWGWYYVGGVLDDYSRYLITYQVIKDMTGQTLCDLVQQAVEATGIEDVPVAHKPTLLSDNGSGCISRPFNEYLELMQIRHIFTARLHPQTIGKFERLNRTAKDRLGLVIYTSPEELERAVARFQRWYNHERYHESIGNLRPVEVYQGRAEEILSRRKELKRQTLTARREYNLGVSHQQERSGQTGSEVHPISRPAVSERL